jgi:GntR family transcriptional repressor for pyruvate dehydrogenase complex
LTLLGVLEARPGSGTYVKNTASDLLPEVIEWGLLLGEPKLRDVVEARLFIEVALSRLAAERRDAKAIKSLHFLLEKMGAGRSREDFGTADLAFHLRIAEAAGNDVLAGILRSVRALLAVWIRMVVSVENNLDELYSEHRAVFEAIKAGDPDLAGSSMERHLLFAQRRLTATLEAERQSEKAFESLRGTGFVVSASP